MNTENEIGKIEAVEAQKKEWPKITIIVSLIISVVICIRGIQFSQYEYMLVVLLYWLLFLLYQVFRFSRKKVFQFGTDGCIRYYRKGRTTSETIIMYKDIKEPEFNIIDLKVNGYHSSYQFTIDFGEISFTYSYDHDDIPTEDFDYICAHRLYRCWKKYRTGQEFDYKESDRIALGMLHNLVKS